MGDDWKKVDIGNTWNYIEEGKGAEIQGTYISKEESVGENESVLYRIKVNEELVSIWGSTVLNVKFKNITIGSEVKVIYLGRVDSQKRKGKTYHDFDVYYRESPMQKVENETPFPPEE
jgi:hypothetical protein